MSDKVFESLDAFSKTMLIVSVIILGGLVFSIICDVAYDIHSLILSLVIFVIYKLYQAEND